ncbi:GNAT family N-acetyltransferase [Marinimicrobium sp. C6131]|uniref:GNAT family N-acetyltransferase n=1 Tax=Marinimicrobium sp. C6131 TaxID=3022676 RepID=UPI00223CDDB9|nr:GNAT family N-acetyltransferase [Marinimicrobium sp. C6131]UZJ43925.1 GNAT family N-acetyltransferase [Marinimicrobium sp. C6131]
MTETLHQDEFFPPHHRQGLFYSSAWQEAWHEAYGNHPAIRLHPDAGLYSYPQKLKGLLPVRSATPIGATSPGIRSIRAEYLVLTDATTNVGAEQLLGKLTAEKKWDQLCLPDISESFPELGAIQAAARNLGLQVREQERNTAFAVDLSVGGFENYLASLGKNTRLKLFNRRKKLEEAGKVALENWWPSRREAFYKTLNQFHEKRWGKPCYRGRSLAFIDKLLTRLDQAGARIDLSVITLDGEPVSTTLDIAAQGRCYNLQAGYAEDLVKNLSLGTLHLGYQIEKAFQAQYDHYDFMAGEGKNTQYKASLANCQADLITLLLVRHPLLKLAYRVQDRLSKTAITEGA